MEKVVKEKKLKKFSISPFAIIMFAILVLYTISLFYPLLWGLNISLKDASTYGQNIFGLDWPFRFDNYGKIFTEFTYTVSSTQQVFYIWDMLWFTFLYAVCCSFINIAVICLVAYITARYNYKICKIIDAVVIVAMILPVVGSMPSELRIMKSLGLYNSLWGMMIMKANFVGGSTFLIFNVSFRGLPKDFAEAAEIDGASNLKVMLSIMLPLAKNMFMTLWLLSFVQYWNDYQTPLLYFPDNPTLSYGLFVFTQSDLTSVGRDLPIGLAACFLALIPILLVFLFASERLMGNVSMGGLKE